MDHASLIRNGEDDCQPGVIRETAFKCQPQRKNTCLAPRICHVSVTLSVFTCPQGVTGNDGCNGQEGTGERVVTIRAAISVSKW